MLALYVISRSLKVHNASCVPIKWMGVVPNICNCVCSRLSAHKLEERDNDSIVGSRKCHQHKYNSLLKPNIFLQHNSFHNNFSKDGSHGVEVKRKAGTFAAAFVNNSASSLQPYMKLMRIDKPIGKYTCNGGVKIIGYSAAMFLLLTLWDETVLKCHNNVCLFFSTFIREYIFCQQNP